MSDNRPQHVVDPGAFGLVKYSCAVTRSPEQLARRYIAWVRGRIAAILIAHVVVTSGALYLITNHLPLYADFSYLLPEDAPAVRDLRRLEARLVAGDSVLVILEAPTAGERAAALAELTAGVATLPAELVARVDSDDAELRGFLKAHRHLFVPAGDLETARAAPRAGEAEGEPAVHRPRSGSRGRGSRSRAARRATRQAAPR